ncbi:MAG: hypothetical protein ACLFV7_09685 [Phycisphaerae bacterium]
MKQMLILALVGAVTWAVLSRPSTAADDSSRKPNAEKKKTATTQPDDLRRFYTVSRETTFIKGPFNSDGTVNYFAYLQKKHSKGVTKAQNAAVPLVRAVGPSIGTKEHVKTIEKKLDLKLPAGGDYFLPLDDYANTNGLDRRKMWNLLDETISEPWTAKKHPHIANWLKANAPSLKLARQATERSSYYLPGHAAQDPPEMVAMLLPRLGRIRSVARALNADAMRKLGAGQPEAASQDFLRVHRLGRRVGTGPTIIERLVGLSIDGMATNGGRALATADKVDTKLLTAHIEALGKLPPLPGMAEAIDEGERFFALDTVMMFLRDGISVEKIMAVSSGSETSTKSLPRWLIDYDQLLKRFNDMYDRQVAIARADSPGQRAELAGKFEEDMKALKTRVDTAYVAKQIALAAVSHRDIRRKRTTQVLGDLLVGILMPALERASDMHNRQQLTVDVVRVGLAMRLYLAENGRLPAKLTALSPKYLKKVPRDWFTGDSLVYKTGKREGSFIVYSLGMDRIDQDGRGPDEGRKGETQPDDVAVKYRWGK